MAERQTEKRDSRAHELDLRTDGDILKLLAAGQVEAASSIAGAAEQIGEAANLMADSLRQGGRLVYAAAGSSGLMALADALEIPGTFGIDRTKIKVLLAGGMAALSDMRGGPEDDGAAAEAEVAAMDLQPRDCLIALTASGATPFPLAAARVAGAAGARTVGIANNEDAALFRVVNVGICLRTPPEIIAGSTRMGAGTAQKITLNMLSTLMAIRLGHVHDGLMVNLLADNEKLRIRARGIVAAVAGVEAAEAARALERAEGAVKPAILIAAGADSGLAQDLLKRHGGVLRPALAELSHLRAIG